MQFILVKDKKITIVTNVEKAFSQADHLKKHIDVFHSNQKDHQCDSCGTSFSYAGYLKTHHNAVHKSQM